jgi:hypothetical protein
MSGYVIMSGYVLTLSVAFILTLVIVFYVQRTPKAPCETVCDEDDVQRYHPDIDFADRLIWDVEICLLGRTTSLYIWGKTGVTRYEATESYDEIRAARAAGSDFEFITVNDAKFMINPADIQMMEVVIVR